MSSIRFWALFMTPCCGPRVPQLGQCIYMTEGVLCSFRVVNIGPVVFEIYSIQDLWPFMAPYWRPRAQWPSQCTSMAKGLSFGFWIMQISPLVSDVLPKQIWVFGGPFWALVGTLNISDVLGKIWELLSSFMNIWLENVCITEELEKSQPY